MRTFAVLLAVIIYPVTLSDISYARDNGCPGFTLEDDGPYFPCGQDAPNFGKACAAVIYKLCGSKPTMECVCRYKESLFKRAAKHYQCAISTCKKDNVANCHDSAYVDQKCKF